MSNFVNALESRRSQYALAGTSKLADREVVDLIAQMPFGDVVEPVGEKTVVPVEERVRVIGL